jgi:hypothetical protein
MSDEARMNPAPVADGFDDEREDQQTRVIQGEKWQFTNDSIWVNSDEEEIMISTEQDKRRHCDASSAGREPGARWCD